MFTHLHTRTEYSLLDGLSRIPQLLDPVQALGQPAIALQSMPLPVAVVAKAGGCGGA